jgi:excisionase family DNA binding protein
MASHTKTKGTDRRQAARPQAQRRDQDGADSRARDESTRSGDRESPADTIDDSAFTDFLNGGWGTAVEGCRYLSLSLSVLRRETRRGRIKAYVVGGRKLIRYRKSDLDAYLESQAVAVLATSRGRR